MGLKIRGCKKEAKSEAHVLLTVQKDHEWLDCGVFEAMGNYNHHIVDGCL